MNVTKDDAETALREVSRARAQSLTLFQYGLASPYLLLWGGLWIVAGVIGALSPDNTGIGWAIVDTIGIVATGYLVVSRARRHGRDGSALHGLRYGASVAVLGAFIAVTCLVFAPVSSAEIQTFITMLIAAIYMIAGFWAGRRFAVVGAILAALTIGAFHFAPAHLPLIVSVLGGSALILGGIWLRRA